MECKWLPPFYKEPDWNNYVQFEEELYDFFYKIYIGDDNKLYFDGREVKYRFKPYENGKEEFFYHITCDSNVRGSYKNRTPCTERIKRIEWPKAFINNYICNYNCCENKPLYWKKEYINNGNIRHFILFQRYIIILEDRKEYFLFITGYYIEEEYRLRGFYKEYAKYK